MRSASSSIRRYEWLFEIVAIILLVPAAFLEVCDMYTAAGAAVAASERYSSRHQRNQQLRALLDDTLQHRGFLESERASLERDLSSTRARNRGLWAAMDDAQIGLLLSGANASDGRPPDAPHSVGAAVRASLPLLAHRHFRSFQRPQSSAKVSLPPPPRRVVFVDAAMHLPPPAVSNAANGTEFVTRLALYRSLLPRLLADRAAWAVHVINTRRRANSQREQRTDGGGETGTDDGAAESLCTALLHGIEGRDAAECHDVAADVPWEPAQRVNYALRLGMHPGPSTRTNGVVAVIPVSGGDGHPSPTPTAREARRLVPQTACERDPEAAFAHLLSAHEAVSIMRKTTGAAWACRPNGAAVFDADAVWRAAGEADVRLPSVELALEELMARVAFDLRTVVVDVTDVPLDRHRLSVTSIAMPTDTARERARSAATGARRRGSVQQTTEPPDVEGLPTLQRWGHVPQDAIQAACSAVARYDMAATVPGGLPPEARKPHHRRHANAVDAAVGSVQHREWHDGDAAAPTDPVVMRDDTRARGDARLDGGVLRHRGGLFRPDVDIAEIVRGRVDRDADPDAEAAAAAGLTPLDRDSSAQSQLDAANTHPADLVVDWPTRIYVEEKWLRSAGLGGAPYGVELVSVEAARGLSVRSVSHALWKHRQQSRRNDAIANASSAGPPPRRGDAADDCYVHRVVARPGKVQTGDEPGFAHHSIDTTTVVGFIVAMRTPVSAQLDDRAVVARACAPEQLLKPARSPQRG